MTGEELDKMLSALDDYIKNELTAITKLKENDDKLASFILLILQREKVMANGMIDLQNRLSALENIESKRADYVLGHLAISGREQ